MPPLSYQWRRYTNTTTFGNIPGETNATLVVTNIQPTFHRFGVNVTDGNGLSTNSSLARLTVVLPPSIATEPSNQNAVAGERATLSVVATGTAPLSYQWFFNSQPRSGVTSSNLVFASVQLSNAGADQVIMPQTNHRPPSPNIRSRSVRYEVFVVEDGSVSNRVLSAVPPATQTSMAIPAAILTLNCSNKWAILSIAT